MDRTTVKIEKIESKPLEKPAPKKVLKVDYNRADNSWMFKFRSWTDEVVEVKLSLRTDIKILNRSMLDKIHWRIAVDVFALKDKTGADLKEPKRIRTLDVAVPDIDVPEDPHQMMSNETVDMIRRMVIHDAQSALLESAARGWLITVAQEFNPHNIELTMK